MYQAAIHKNRFKRLLRGLVAPCIAMLLAGSSMAAGQLSNYLQKVQPQEIFPGATRFGEVTGDPPIAPVFRGESLPGYAYLNSDVTSSVGYSGKPIHIVVGIDPKGVVRGLKLVDHKEPIVLIGIPEAKVVASVNALIGKDLGRVSAGAERPPQVDIVSGATVTVLVMGDSIVRSALKLIRGNRFGADAVATGQSSEIRKVDLSRTGTSDWETLVGDGSVRSLRLTVGEVTEAFRQAGQPAAAGRPETHSPGDRFIDLFIAPVSVPVIGRSLLGDTRYEQMRAKLKPGEEAIVVAGHGAYSFKGSGYVRGGIFDRIELLQDGQGLRFRDRYHTRLPTLAAAGAPRLREIALFVVPADFDFDVTAPWELQLLVQRSAGGRDDAMPTSAIPEVSTCKADYVLPVRQNHRLSVKVIVAPRRLCSLRTTKLNASTRYGCCWRASHGSVRHVSSGESVALDAGRSHWILQSIV